SGSSTIADVAGADSQSQAPGAPGIDGVLDTSPLVSTGDGGELDLDMGSVPEPGACIGRFIVLGTLGSGGMGVGLLAHDQALQRHVAIKLLRPDLIVPDVDGTRAARLLREAQAMAQIAHRNVLAVYDVGTFHDQVFIAMEHVDGETLTEWLKKPR